MKNPKTNESNHSAQKRRIWTKFILLLGLIALSIFLFLQYEKNKEPQIQTVSREGIVSRIQQLNRLETIAFNVDTVITSEQQGTWQQLWQDEQKALFIARGRVVAGVDLSKLSPELVVVSEPSKAQIEMAKNKSALLSNDTVKPLMPNLTITIPPAEIFSVYLDDVEVYDWQGGIFGMGKAEPEIFEQAQSSAKKEVLDRACREGIMQQAEQNAKTQMQQLFAMTGSEVTVLTQGAGACQPLN